jgi:FkbM family methyltransferase
MIFFFTKIYAGLQEIFHQKFKVNIPGLGFLLRMQKKDRTIYVNGKKMFFNHKIADNYARLINGRFNEPETHLFIDLLLDSFPESSVLFIEVGANIGEFMIDFAGNKKVSSSLFFEPQPEQSFALQKTKEFNEFDKAEIIKKAVTGINGEVKFSLRLNNSSDAGIIADDESDSFKVDAVTLDTVLEDKGQKSILLIDAEGEEFYCHGKTGYNF